MNYSANVSAKSTEKQAGHYGTVAIDWSLKMLNQPAFLWIYKYFFFVNLFYFCEI